MLHTIDIIFSIAAILITTSYLFKDILFLRILSIAGASTYVAGGIIAGHTFPGMKALIFFSLVNLTINAFQCILLVLERRPVLLPDEVKDIYSQSFAMMTTSEFAKIYKSASHEVATKGELLARQNEHINSIIVIQQGLAVVKKNDKIISSLNHGFFVGEFSFITHELANATVEVASDELTYLIWKKEDLYKLQHANSQLYIKFKNAVAINMVKKIDMQMEEV